MRSERFLRSQLSTIDPVSSMYLTPLCHSLSFCWLPWWRSSYRLPFYHFLRGLYEERKTCHSLVSFPLPHIQLTSANLDSKLLISLCGCALLLALGLEFSLALAPYLRDNVHQYSGNHHPSAPIPITLIKVLRIFQIPLFRALSTQPKRKI